MLARECRLPLAMLGTVLASYGQHSLKQQLGIDNTASYNGLKKRISTGETPLFALLSLPLFPREKTLFLLPWTDKVPSAPTPKTRELVSAGNHCTHPRDVSGAQATPGVLSNCKQLPAHTGDSCPFSSMGRTPSFDQVFFG